MNNWPNSICPKCGRTIPGVVNHYGREWICRECADDKSDVLRCERGSRVVFAHPDSGMAGDIQRAQKHLTVGAVYTVESLTIGGWCSELTLKEVPGVKFNTVQFEMEE